MLISILQKLSIAFLVLFCLQLNAQTYFGLRAGTNFANASSAADGGGATTDRIIGVNIGTYFEFGLNKTLSLQPEFNFLQKGYIRDLNKKYPQRFSYLDIAFLLKIKNSEIPLNKKGKKMSIYGTFGPYIGYAVKVTSDGEDRDIGSDNQDDWGLLASAGIALPSGRNGSFVFDIRYVFGLAYIENPDAGWENFRNRGILPSIGYVWKI